MIRKHKGKKPAKETGLALTPQYKETLKFNSWVKHFFNIRDKDVYGNATQSALRVYNTENYNSASVIGHENLRKLKILRVSIADQNGFGFADLIKIGLQKMLTGEFEDWDKMMVRLGYFEPESKLTTAIQNNFDFSGNNLSDAIKGARQERGLSI